MIGVIQSVLDYFTPDDSTLQLIWDKFEKPPFFMNIDFRAQMVIALESWQMLLQSLVGHSSLHKISVNCPSISDAVIEQMMEQCNGPSLTKLRFSSALQRILIALHLLLKGLQVL
jgi:hypothetical protein